MVFRRGGSLFEGRDLVVRAAKLRAGKSFLERPVQHLFPLDIACDNPVQMQNTPDPNPKSRSSRSRRDAAVAAAFRIRDALQDAECRS